MVPCEQHQVGRGAAPQTKKRADRNPRVTRQPIPHIRPHSLPRSVLTFRAAPSWWCGYPAPDRRLARLEPRGRRRPPDALRIFAPPRRSTRRHARPVRSIHHHRPRDRGGARRGSDAQHRSALAGAEAAQIAFGLAQPARSAYDRLGARAYCPNPAPVNGGGYSVGRRCAPQLTHGLVGTQPLTSRSVSLGGGCTGHDMPPRGDHRGAPPSINGGGMFSMRRRDRGRAR
jgi:hypothetical protein